MQNTVFRSMQIIYGALITGVLLFGMVAIFVLQTADLNTFSLDVMGMVAIVFGITGSALGQYLYNTKLQSVKNADTSTKLQTWKTVLITRTALIEGPCLFAVVNLLIGGGQLFVIVYALLLAWMASNFPTRMKVKSDLDISDEEIDSN